MKVLHLHARVAKVFHVSTDAWLFETGSPTGLPVFCFVGSACRNEWPRGA